MRHNIKKKLGDRIVIFDPHEGKKSAQDQSRKMLAFASTACSFHTAKTKIKTNPAWYHEHTDPNQSLSTSPPLNIDLLPPPQVKGFSLHSFAVAA